MFRNFGPAAPSGRPEDWIASITATFANPAQGHSALEDGRILEDAIAADREFWLGPDKTDRVAQTYGPLVKLLSGDERLPVHHHLDRAFASQYLGCDFGKAEAWFILEAPEGALAYVGFRHNVSVDYVFGLVATGRAGGLLGAMNAFPVQAGDTIYVPPGQAYALDAGRGIQLAVVQARQRAVPGETQRFDLTRQDRNGPAPPILRNLWAPPPRQGEHHAPGA